MRKLHHINVIYLYVADLEAACRFYEEALELGEPCVRSEQWVEYALVGETHFALHRTPAEFLEGVEPCKGTMRFSIVVEGLDEWHDRLLAHGAVIIRSPEEGHGFRLLECEDPEGNPIRLIEYDHEKQA